MRELPKHIICDFDGTITPFDVTDAILERFADVRWIGIEEEWESGRITARECMSRQVALIKAKKRELDAFLDTVPIDPAFPAFVAGCRLMGCSLVVVSDGLDYAIDRILKQHGLKDVPHKANHLVHVGANTYTLEFPYGNETCGSGMCKCRIADSYPEVMLIGDGRSDCCVAKKAVLTLAKTGGSLLKECATKNYPYLTYTSFADVPLKLDTYIQN